MIRILIISNKVEYGLAMSFRRAFKKLGKIVDIFDDEDFYKKQFPFLKNRYTHRLFWKLFSLPLQKEFIKVARKERPDLILVLKGWFFAPATLLKIKKELPQTKIFCFNPDNPFNVWHYGNSNSWIRKSIPLYDVYFIWGKFLIDKIKQAGAKKVEYLPFSYDSELHYPVAVNPEEKKIYGSDIAFIGSWDEEREWWLNHLLDYDLKIWGNSWEKANKKLQNKWQKRTVIGEEFSKVCNASKIILNIVRKQNMPAHNMRTFEVPACAGFLLSTRTQEQEEFFEKAKEADYFSTPEELKEKIDFYLRNERLREEITRIGYQRLIKSCYSCRDRAENILKIYASLF